MGTIVGLLILSLVIFLHEMGHFLAAKGLGVPAPIFSVGLGPVIWRRNWGGTEYRLSVLPLGGYVLFGRGENFNETRAFERIIIYAAGPIANFLTALAIFGGDVYLLAGQFWAVMGIVGQLFSGQVGVDQLAGPLGIMEAAGTAATLGVSRLLNFIAFLSINLGVLNLLPLPILDGGQIILAALEGVTRRRVHDNVRIAVALVCWGMILLLIAHVTLNDIARMRGPIS